MTTKHDTSPAEYAELIDPGTDDGIGVQRDTLMDARNRVGLFAHTLQEMYVELDAMLDNAGLLPDEVQHDLRETQRELTEHAAWVEELHDELQDREEEVRARIAEDH